MGLFDKIFKHDKESTKAQASPAFIELNGYKPVFSTYGGNIYENELVRAAIDARARHISKLKPIWYGTARPSLISKLQEAPNEWQTWSQYFYRLSTILDVYNTAITVPVYDEGLTVTGYFPVIPKKCEIVEYDDEPWLRYEFSWGEHAAVELRLCSICTKFQLRDDFFGESNRALDETMKLLSIQQHGIEAAIENSASYQFMAQLDNWSNAGDLAEERKRFSKKNLSKDAEDGGVLLFPSTWKNVQQVNYSPYHVDADQLNLILQNVSNYFGVNLDVMQNKATGDQLDAFFNGAIEPFAIQWSESMTRAVFTLRERALGAKVEAAANRLQYMTVSEKVAMAQQLLDRGVMTTNEARELFNMSSVPDGDIRYIRGEYRPANEDVQEVGGNENADEE